MSTTAAHKEASSGGGVCMRVWGGGKGGGGARVALTSHFVVGKRAVAFRLSEEGVDFVSLTVLGAALNRTQPSNDVIATGTCDTTTIITLTTLPHTPYTSQHP